MRSPASSPRRLSVETLEPRQMLSNTSLELGGIPPEQDEMRVAAASLLSPTFPVERGEGEAAPRSEPLTLLSGRVEFNGKDRTEIIPDQPVFTEGSFTIDTWIRPDALRNQAIVSKYSSQGKADRSFFLGMLADGRLQFIVYADADAKVTRGITTEQAPLKVGTWQHLVASFDRDTQAMKISVDGKDVSAKLENGSKEVSAIFDGTCPMLVGSVVFSSGPTQFFEGGLGDSRFHVGAWTETEIAEGQAKGAAAPPKVSAAVIQEAAPLAEPLTLLSDRVEFNGKDRTEIVADQPVFTEGSFTIDTWIRPDALRDQAIVSKYSSQGKADRSFFLGMLADGRLQFVIYADAEAKVTRGITTEQAPLTVGTWQHLVASFNRDTQAMKISVDGKDVAAKLENGSKEVSALYDGTCPVRMGSVVFSSGPTSFYKGGLGASRFYVGAFSEGEIIAGAQAKTTAAPPKVPAETAQESAVDRAITEITTDADRELPARETIAPAAPEAPDLSSPAMLSLAERGRQTVESVTGRVDTLLGITLSAAIQTVAEARSLSFGEVRTAAESCIERIERALEHDTDEESALAIAIPA
ncbi:MAG: LamG domain-containing protein, partial [Candidatus Peregrinibacteria bacterium]